MKGKTGGGRAERLIRILEEEGLVTSCRCGDYQQGRG